VLSLSGAGRLPTSVSTRYSGLEEHPIAWRVLYLFAWPLALPYALKGDSLGRNRRQFLTDWLNSCFGPTPDLHARHHSSILTTGLLFLPTYVLVGLTLFPGVVMYAVGVDGALVSKVILLGGTIGFIPFLTGAIWGFRATVSEIHYRRWTRTGSIRGELPPASSQPKDVDVIIGLLWAIAMVLCAVIVVVN
jgi:hypothetical protein